MGRWSGMSRWPSTRFGGFMGDLLGAWWTAGRVLAVVFMVLAGPLLVVQALLIPPGYVPDEPDHAARAEGLSHGSVMGMRGEVSDQAGRRGVVSGVWADPAITAADRAVVPGAPKVVTRVDLDRLLAVRWGVPGFVPSSVAPYFPVFYGPEALAIGVVRAAGGTPLAAVYAGRLAGVVGFVVLGVLALTLATRGAVLIFATLMLPMTLWLASSLNQDGVMIGTACLVAAMLTRDGARARWGAALGLACIAAAKAPYLPLVALLLLPMRGAVAGVAAARLVAGLGQAVLAALPALAWTALTVRFVSASLVQAPYRAGPLYGDAAAVFDGPNLGAQLEVLTRPLTRLVSVPLGSAAVQAPEMLRQMVGGLGNLDIALPGPVYAGWLVALVAAVAAAVWDGAGRGGVEWIRVGWGWMGCVVAALALFGCVLLIYVSLYLTWTPVGLEHVTGVQGRYFLPLLPFAMFCLPASGRRPGWSGGLGVPAVVMAAVGVVMQPVLIVGSFYLR